ncbi:MAG: hypothetical protein LBI49_15525, partial [Nocardiopsaceae bacterium]|nr:hypothetical protein [Nocardiopsaceae bacterium]
AAECGVIPYRGEAAYDDLLAFDGRLRWLQRSFVNAAADPPAALPPASRPGCRPPAAQQL